MSINLLRRQYEGTPQHSHLFGVEFGQNRDVIYWLMETDIPARTVNIGTIDWLNGQYKYAARPELQGTWTCTFVAYEDMAAYTFLENWWSRIFDINTGVIGREEFHKDTVSVFMLDSTGRTKTVEWIMYGVILEKFGLDGPLTMGTDKVMTVAASFQYEYYRTKLGGAGLSDGTVLSVAESAINALV